MNRRGFLGSCAAAAVAPLVPKLVNTAGAAPQEIIGYVAPTTGAIPNYGWSTTFTVEDLEGAKFWYAPEQRWYVVGKSVT